MPASIGKPLLAKGCSARANTNGSDIKGQVAVRTAGGPLRLPEALVDGGAEIVRAKFGRAWRRDRRASGRRMSSCEIAEGFLKVAVKNMAKLDHLIDLSQLCPHHLRGNALAA
jgi:hypothetical protein